MTRVVGSSEPRGAGLQARLVAFIFDTVILVAFLALFGMIAMFQLLVRSNFGDSDPPNAAFYAAIGIVAAVIPFWVLFNVWLLSWRGQTVGKYIVGIRIARSDGGRLGSFRALLRMFLLNPLLFHPALVIPWTLLVVLSTQQTRNAVVLFTTATVLVLSVLATPVALVTVLSDRKRRALHDRIVDTLVVAGD